MSRARDFADLAGSADAGGITGRNLVHNGAMLIHQRATSRSDISGSGYYVHDRHRISMGNTAGRLRMSGSGVAPDGFANSLRLQCTTADTSIAANEDFSLQHRFEGQNLQQLKKGTSGAESVTVSFYMKTNKAFTFVCELDDTDNNRFNGQRFTTTTDWTRHVLTFVGDTTGTLDDDNARSLQLSFWLHAGSNYTSGTYTANTWQSRASTDVNRAVGIGSFFDSTDNEIRLTGLQMEVGNQATPFDHSESYGETLARCQRYYWQLSTGVHGNYPSWAATGYNTNQCNVNLPFPVPMRTVPTASFNTGNVNYYRFYRGGSNENFGNVATDTITSEHLNMYGDGLSHTQGLNGSLQIRLADGAGVFVTAEL